MASGACQPSINWKTLVDFSCLDVCAVVGGAVADGMAGRFLMMLMTWWLSGLQDGSSPRWVGRWPSRSSRARTRPAGRCASSKQHLERCAGDGDPAAAHAASSRQCARMAERALGMGGAVRRTTASGHKLSLCSASGRNPDRLVGDDVRRGDLDVFHRINAARGAWASWERVHAKYGSKDAAVRRLALCRRFVVGSP